MSDTENEEENKSIKRSKVGWMMYNICNVGTQIIIGRVWLWRLLNLTWGVLGTIIGAVIALVVRVFVKRKAVEKFCATTCYIFGNNWGGLEGVFFIFVADGMGKKWTRHTKEHEYGHSFQNAILGPLFPFIVLIPSVIRYWYQRVERSKGKEVTNYDDAWFEGSASLIGKMAALKWASEAER